MKEKYVDQLEVEIFTTDSPQALAHNFRSSTNMLFNGELISVDIAVDKTKMEDFLSKNL
jgi:hypothetical protein